MNNTKEIREIYEIMFDEIDFFMENVYQDNLMYQQALAEMKDVPELPEEIKDVIESLDNADLLLSRLDNMKLLLKSIAYQNHSLELFTDQEREEFAVKVLLGRDTEVL